MRHYRHVASPIVHWYLGIIRRFSKLSKADDNVNRNGVTHHIQVYCETFKTRCTEVKRTIKKAKSIYHISEIEQCACDNRRLYLPLNGLLQTLLVLTWAIVVRVYLTCTVILTSVPWRLDYISGRCSTDLIQPRHDNLDDCPAPMEITGFRTISSIALLPFSQEYAQTVSPSGEWSSRACSFTIVIFTAISAARL